MRSCVLTLKPIGGMSQFQPNTVVPLDFKSRLRMTAGFIHGTNAFCSLALIQDRKFNKLLTSWCPRLGRGLRVGFSYPHTTDYCLVAYCLVEWGGTNIL